MKNKWLKSLALGLVIMTLIITPSIGEEVSKQLDIENLEEMITVSSLDIQIAKSNVEVASYKLNLSEDKKGTGTTSLETQKSLTYNIDSAKKDLEYAKSNRDNIIDTTIIDGKNQFYLYILKDKEAQLLTNKISRLSSDLAQIKTKVDIGLSVSSDVATKELEIQKVEVQLKALEIEKQEILLKLNQYLMWDIDTVIEIVSSDLPKTGRLDFDLEVIKDYQLANNLDLIKLNAEEDLASEYLRILYSIGKTNSDSEVTSAKVSITDTGYNVKDKELQVAMNVYSSYNELLNLRDQVTINGLDVNNVTSTLDRLQKRFEVGFETQSTINEANETLEFAKLALSYSELNYYIAYEKFKNLEEKPKE